MCTVINHKSEDHYFGRNLDWQFSYGEKIVLTPRNYEFNFRAKDNVKAGCAMMGMGLVIDGYPLYFDAVNESGLCMAGLNFPSNAVYFPPVKDKDNIAPFELIPWVLSQAKTAKDAKELLLNTNVLNEQFSDDMELAPLHWIISDSGMSITAESTKDGLHIYDNPTGVLTNNPTFDIHMHNLNNYMYLSPEQPRNTFSDKLVPDIYSGGMGTIGLPGGMSSEDRFIRASFLSLNAVECDGETACVSQVLSVLSAVMQIKGAAKTDNGYNYTVYSICCNADKGIYYYKTYESYDVLSFDMHEYDLNSDTVIICN